MKTAMAILGLLLMLALRADADEARQVRKFDFGSGTPAPGFTRVEPTTFYNPERGYGFEPATGGAITSISSFSGGSLLPGSTACVSEQPFYFSVSLPEGNYRVSVTLGNPATGSTNSVKAELRRLMLQAVTTAPSQTVQRVFSVNLRQPQIRGGGEVRLKDRERTSEHWAWDGKLTLEFNGTRPSVCALEVEPTEDLPTVFLLGDSTVCDQPQEPWNSWGQMLPRFFKPSVVVANHAESGETLKSSIASGRIAKVLSLMKPGDYVFVQFGHNDMKDPGTNALGVYAANLRQLVAEIREKGGQAVLVTSMERKSGLEQNTLAGYPDAVRRVAREEKVPLIDLHAMSRTLYSALGADLDKAFQDGTHHNSYGSYELAKCVVQSIKDLATPSAASGEPPVANLRLSGFIVDDFTPFDPAHPDPVAQFHIPPSPGPSGSRPSGD